MTDAHERFRSRLAESLAGLLPEAEAAWMDAHAAECAECTELLMRMRARLPALAVDAEHAPVSLLENWVRAPGKLTALERELLERHLDACDSCREEARELASLAGLAPPRIRVPHHWRGPLGAGFAAAAVLTAIFAVRLSEHTSPPVQVRPQPVAPAEPAPAEPLPALTIALRERSRGEAPGGEPSAATPVPGAALRLKLPPLFIDDAHEVLVRLEDGEGAVVWEARMSARALGDTLAPTVGAAGWHSGPYLLRVVPEAGRDSAAARVFAFRLLPRIAR